MGGAVFTSSFHHVLPQPLSKENHVLLGEAGTEMVHLEICFEKRSRYGTCWFVVVGGKKITKKWINLHKTMF